MPVLTPQVLTGSSSRTRLRLVEISLLVIACVLFVPSSSFAAISGCRGDPIVWLSNGQMVQMAAIAEAPAANVRRIVYTLHAPRGLSVSKIVYTGGALQSKEKVVFAADLDAGTYSTDTLVETKSRHVRVTAITHIGSQKSSLAGTSGKHLITHFRLSQ